MDDPLVVRGVQRVSHLARDRERLADWQRAILQGRGKRLSLHQLKDDEPRAARLFDAVDRGNVRMIQRREDLRFPLEARHPFGIGMCQIRERLDGDVPAEARIAGAIDLAHAAGADGGEDLIRSNLSAGLEPQMFSPPPASAGDN